MLFKPFGKSNNQMTSSKIVFADHILRHVVMLGSQKKSPPEGPGVVCECDCNSDTENLVSDAPNHSPPSR
jgi:hypothetical protein